MDLSTREGRRQQGERIKQAAREIGLTLDELARRIGCSRALIFQYASGASLAQSDRLQQIAAVVGKPLPWFFQDDATVQEPLPAGTAALTSAEQAEVRAERERLAAERTRFDQRRAAEDIARLEALLAAYASPADPRKVVDCCQQLTPLLARDEDPQRLAAVLLQQGNALIQLQEWGAAKEKLEHAGTLYRQAGKLIAARDCMQSLGHANLMLGRVEEALQQFEYVATGEDWSNRWQGTLSIGAAYEVLGDYSAAIAAFERALEIVEERQDEPAAEAARLYIEANWSNLELDFGDYRSALHRAQRCIRMAQRQGVQDQYIEALLTGGVAHLHLADTQSAIHSIQQALDVADLIGDQQHRSLALSCLSLCDTALRRTAEAIAEGKEALAVALRCSAVRAEIAAQRALAEAYLLSSDPSEALYHAQQGQIVAANIRVRLPQAQFGALKARTQLATGHFAEALVEADKALRLAMELHARPLQLEAHVVLAQAGLGAGVLEAALTHGNAVIDMAASLQVPDAAWKGRFVVAEAALRQDRQAEAKSAFQQAITALDLVRRRYKDAGEEDTAMEDPLAMDLWQSWLRVVAATDGPEQARANASEADWPPLLEWLEPYLQTKDLQTEGGQADA